MTPAQHFGVMVRTVGLLVAISSGGTTFTGFVWASSVQGDAGIVALALALIVAVVQLLFGLWLMRSPKWLVTFAYPEEREPAGRLSSAAS